MNSENGEPLPTCPQCGEPAVPSPGLPSVMTSIPPTPPSLAQQAVALPYGELQQAAIYESIVRTLRGIGIGNIIWGALLAIVGAFIAFSQTISAGSSPTLPPLFGMILLVFGVVFIAEGIWLIAAPTAAGLLVAAITLFFNAVLFFNGIIVMLIIVFYGISLLQRFKKFGPLMAERPPDALRKEAGDLLDKLTKARRKNTADYIEFSTTNLYGRRLWRGLLQEDQAVLIAVEARIGRTIADVVFLSPANLGIEVSRREVLGRWLKGTFYLYSEKLSGTIPPECFDRYKAWKARFLLPEQPPSPMPAA
jgi:uncharacterized protein YjeT (DUF2065 family)